MAIYGLEVRAALFVMINDMQYRALEFDEEVTSVCVNQVLESVVKNCGQTIHDEVASKQTMEELKELFKVNLYYTASDIEEISFRYP